MNLVSIRTQMILFSLTLVVATSAICGFLIITAAENAIKKTEDSGNSGISDAFMIAERNVKTMASDLMSSILATSVTFITDFIHSQRRLLGAQRDFYTVLADTPVMIEGRPVPGLFDFNALLEAQIKIYAELSNSGATGLGTQTSRGQLVGLSQRPATIGTNWSEYMLIKNNGTDSGQQFSNTMSGLVDSRLNYINTKWNCSGGIACLKQEQSAENYDAASCSVPVMIDRDGHSCPVYLFLDAFPGGAADFIPMYIIPEGKMAWSPIMNAGAYVGVYLFAPISSKLVAQPAPLIGRKIGFTMLGMDSRHISDFLKTIKLPQGALLFVVVPKNEPMIPFHTIGTMVGTTRGNPYKMVNVTDPMNRQFLNVSDPFPLNCTESPDSLTKATCNYILDQPGGFLGFNPKQTYTVPLLDKQHFLKVEIVSEVQTGLMWAVVIVVPYKTIMGPIDEGTAATHAKVKKNSDDTKKSKEQSYVIMYILLAVTAFIELGIGIFFVFAITRLQKLEVENVLVTKKKDMLDFIFHEVRNPSHVLVHSMAAIPKEVAAEWTEYQEAVVVLNQLVGTLDNMNKIIELEDPSYHSEVEECQMQRFLLECGVFQSTVDASVPESLSFNKAEIAVALSQVLANAKRHGKSSPTVTCSCVDAKTLRVDVKDDGPGLSETQLETLFLDFTVKKHSAVRSHGGSGLGLAVASRAMKCVGGTLIVAQSAPGAGSTFRLEFPFTKAQDGAEPHPVLDPSTGQ